MAAPEVQGESMKKKVLKAAIYIRVSTLDQAREGYSLEAQEAALRKWCAEHGYVIYDLYADKGISGKDMDHRPDMLRLMRDAKNGCFDMVVFWALSRFTRSVRDLYDTMTKFQAWNISMVSYTESFDTSTPMGRAMIGIVGVFAQLERELTGERVSAAMLARAQKGKRTCSEILGYDLKGKDSFVINKKEAETLRLPPFKPPSFQKVGVRVLLFRSDSQHALVRKDPVCHRNRRHRPLQRQSRSFPSEL